ncbi:MAG TPA: hypothetical protein VF341_10405 [Anaeromyxobacteraceae bacterium]
MDQTTLGELSAELDRSASGLLHVRLAGKSSSRDAGKVLAPLFDEILAAAEAEQRAVVLHFERLEYFTSSTIAALIQFARAAQDRSVPLTVTYDGRQKWVTMSFDALKRALRPPADGKPGVVFMSTIG